MQPQGSPGPVLHRHNLHLNPMPGSPSTCNSCNSPFVPVPFCSPSSSLRQRLTLLLSGFYFSPPRPRFLVWYRGPWCCIAAFLALASSRSICLALFPLSLPLCPPLPPSARLLLRVWNAPRSLARRTSLHLSIPDVPDPMPGRPTPAAFSQSSCLTTLRPQLHAPL